MCSGSCEARGQPHTRQPGPPHHLPGALLFLCRPRWNLPERLCSTFLTDLRPCLPSALCVRVIVAIKALPGQTEVCRVVRGDPAALLSEAQPMGPCVHPSVHTFTLTPTSLSGCFSSGSAALEPYISSFRNVQLLLPPGGFGPNCAQTGFLPAASSPAVGAAP